MARMAEEDLNALRAAAATLERPGLAARLGNIAGKPIELVSRAVPEAASKAVTVATTKALDAALAVALRTMEKKPKAASRLLHKALASSAHPYLWRQLLLQLGAPWLREARRIGQPQISLPRERDVMAAHPVHQRVATSLG